MLRRLEPFEAAFLDRIGDDNRRTTARGRAQRREHAGMVGAGIVPDAEDGVRLLEIIQRHRAFADAD